MANIYKLPLTVVLVTLFALIGTFTPIFAGDGSKGFSQVAKQAIGDDDYVSFVAAIRGTRLEGKVSKAKFEQVVEKDLQNRDIKEAVDSHYYDAFQKAVVGSKYEGQIERERFNGWAIKSDKKDAIRDAIEAYDYDAFKIATTGTPHEGSAPTEDHFTDIADVHNADNGSKGGKSRGGKDRGRKGRK